MVLGPDGSFTNLPPTIEPQIEWISETIDLANDSLFGLASSVFTSDPDKANRVAEELATGMVWINCIVKTSPELPFGGVKGSGVGRELARFGFDEFANKKLVRNPKGLCKRRCQEHGHRGLDRLMELVSTERDNLIDVQCALLLKDVSLLPGEIGSLPSTNLDDDAEQAILDR